MFSPTDEQRQLVEIMAAFQIPETKMGLLIRHQKTGEPISDKTIRKYFAKEIVRGAVNADMRVMAGMFKNATTPTPAFPGGNPTIQIFWSKVRMGWKDPTRGAGEGNPGAGDGTIIPEDEIPIDNNFARRVAYLLEGESHRVED